MRNEAYELVTTIPNVHQIYNEIILATPISHTQRIKDSWITAKAKSAMLPRYAQPISASPQKTA